MSFSNYLERLCLIKIFLVLTGRYFSHSRLRFRHFRLSSHLVLRESLLSSAAVQAGQILWRNPRWSLAKGTATRFSGKQKRKTRWQPIFSLCYTLSTHLCLSLRIDRSELLSLTEPRCTCVVWRVKKRQDCKYLGVNPWTSNVYCLLPSSGVVLPWNGHVFHYWILAIAIKLYATKMFI